ncbi:WAS/WASL-interacting protein family member 1-like [Saccostrea echinata]|uniref:WAS/WASL-interacting protein family member 1-like n=1 Tax=Saccostrea echinata TaxID=191078 RepID=UPI002A7FC23C|nr:WAS/WASL-interacting protein family member 1-like [Saccostrea echinata]
MAALAMSGAPPPLPSRAGRPDPPSVSTLPRRGPTSTSRPQSSQSPRNRRGSSDELPPPPPRNRHDPLPPTPPSTASLPPAQVNQQRHSSHTLPRNSRSESNLQSKDAEPPRLPPRRGSSFHGAHSSSARPHLTNGSIPAPIQESDDLESRFMFHDVNELPAPPEFKNVKKKYSSKEYERHKRQKRTPEPRND